MKCVIHRQDSYPDNVGHWRCSIALAVLLGRVSAWLLKRNQLTPSVNRSHIPANIRAAWGSDPGLGNVPNDRKQSASADDPAQRKLPEMRVNQLSRDVWGSSSPLLGVTVELEPVRRRLSVNKGTREARLSRVVAQLGWSMDQPKHLPMRQPGGGAPVVVGDVNDDHMAKGCRIVRAGQPKGSLHREASR